VTLEQLVARQSIAEGLYRYCRSLDRMDRALYETVFQPGARLEYADYFEGTAEEFREWVWAAHAGMQSHSHQITNVLAEVDASAGRASSEAYVTVCLRTHPDAAGSATDIVDRGRYLDRWERDGSGEWRIRARRYVSDVQQVAPAGSAPPVTAVRDRTDPSYAVLDGAY
jgi:SnoaL-like domain